MRDAIRKVISLDFGASFGTLPGDARIETLPEDGEQRIALLATSDRLSRKL